MTALTVLALASSIITLSGLASMQAYCYDNESQIGPELSVSVRTSNQTSCQTFLPTAGVLDGITFENDRLSLRLTLLFTSLFTDRLRNHYPFTPSFLQQYA